MNNPLGVSPSKGNQGTTRGKVKKNFDLGGKPESARLCVKICQYGSRQFRTFAVLFSVYIDLLLSRV